MSAETADRHSDGSTSLIWRLAGLVVASWLLFGMAAAGPAAAAEGPRTFTYAGHCTELQLGAPADDAGMRKLVPDPFLPVGSPIRTVATLGVAECESTANGRHVGRWTGGIVGTPIVPTTPEAALTRYWLWNVGNSPAIEAGFRRMGLRTAFVRGTRLTVGPSTLGLTEAHARVPRRRFRYTLEGRVADATAVPLAGASVFWHRGKKGLVKVTFEISNGTLRSGTGRIQAAPGSRVARLVGAKAPAGAALLGFDFKGTAELVDREPFAPGQRLQGGKWANYRQIGGER